MGGHAAGDVASRMAIDAIIREWRALDDASEALQRALTLANRSIYSASMNNRELGGMGTTCVAMIVRNGKAWCAHVGDSRCYRYRDGELHRMTEDHSAVMEMVQRGELTPEAARTHPFRNVIRRALGAKSDVDVTVWPEPSTLLPGDQFLLCSDGLHDVVDDDEIGRVLADNAPRRACDVLVELARSRGAPDNVTVALLAVSTPIERRNDHVFEPVENERLAVSHGVVPAPSH
jgi:protein phosphatase